VARHRILFVDDDSLVQEFYQFLGAFLGGDYEVFSVNNGSDALNLLSEGPMDVVVSDLAMPGMSGQELMLRLLRTFPESVRFIVSSHADQLTVAQSLMFAHRYFHKPFGLKPFCEALQRICRLKHLVGAAKIKRVICGLGALPTPPEIYFKLGEAINCPKSSVESIAEIVAQDPALTLKVLQIVNSAEFGIARKIIAPAEAINILGVEILRALMLSIQAFKFYETKSNHSLSLKQLWTHCLKIAVAAKRLARYERLSAAEAEEAFVAGLLHDIGKLVLSANAPADYQLVTKRSRAGEMSVSELEQEVFGATHAQVGAYLLGLWGLPDAIIDAVESHHCFSQLAPDHFSAGVAVQVAQCLEFPQERMDALDRTYLEQSGLWDRVEEWKNVLADA
jgi:putative nucleotidyltransferase with HDIG domain